MKRRSFLKGLLSAAASITIVGVAIADVPKAIKSRVYRARDVKIFWNGVELEGLAPDSMITFSHKDGIPVDLSPDKQGEEVCTLSTR